MNTFLAKIFPIVFVLTIAACSFSLDPYEENVVIVNDGTDTVYYHAMTIRQSYVVDIVPEMLRDNTTLPFIGPGFWATMKPVDEYKQDIGIAVFVYRPALRNDTSFIIMDTLVRATHAELVASRYVRIP